MPYSPLSLAATSGVGHALDGERGDRQRPDRQVGAEEADPGDGGESAAQPASELVVVVGDGVPADVAEGVDGGVQGDGADDVGGTRLFTLGRVGPGDLVQVDEVDGATTGEERVAVGEAGPGADQHPGAERGVHLVTAPRHVVGGGGQRSVGGELGGVDEHGDRTGVSGGDHGVERRRPAGHVRGAGDRQQRRGRSGVEGGGEVVEVECSVRAAVDEAAPAQAGPGQQVGVVLDHGGDDDVVRLEPEPVGEVVDRLGRVAADDGHVVTVGGAAGEAHGRCSRRLVGLGGQP